MTLFFALSDWGKSIPVTVFFNTFYKIQKDVRVTVYPNPTAENFSIKIELDKNAEVEISIFNAIGKSIYNFKETANQGTYLKAVIFEDQPSGIYFVNVKAADIKSVEKLIKIK